MGGEAESASDATPSVRNLATAAEMGFTTVLVRAPSHNRDEESAGPGEHPDHVHFAVDDLTNFIEELHQARAQRGTEP